MKKNAKASSKSAKRRNLDRRGTKPALDRTLRCVVNIWLSIQTALDFIRSRGIMTAEETFGVSPERKEEIAAALEPETIRVLSPLFQELRIPSVFYTGEVSYGSQEEEVDKRTVHVQFEPNFAYQLLLAEGVLDEGEPLTLARDDPERFDLLQPLMKRICDAIAPIITLQDLDSFSVDFGFDNPPDHTQGSISDDDAPSGPEATEGGASLVLVPVSIDEHGQIVIHRAIPKEFVTITDPSDDE